MGDPREAPPKPVPAVKGDGLSGIYFGLTTSADLGGSPVRDVTEDYLTLFPDGTLYWGLPPEGLLSFTMDEARKLDPDRCGTYKLEDGRIVADVRWQGGKVVLERDGERLKRADDSRSLRPSLTAEALKLVGAYRRSEIDKAITFSADGKFEDAGAFANWGTIQLNDASQIQDDGKPGKGAYRLERSTLELKYEDGRVKRFSFIAFPDGVSGGVVSRMRLGGQIVERLAG